jgi:hypothetical protein
MWKLYRFPFWPLGRNGRIERGSDINLPLDQATSQQTPNSLFGFPLIVIDFEATALTNQSYPIEVGIAIAERSRGPMQTWSLLIKPAPAWDMATHWDPDAERLHGISRWDLRSGATARHAMEKLNALIGPIGHAWCDGGDYDRRWLAILADAAGAHPRFELRDVLVGLESDQLLQSRYREALASSRPPHRAGPDAARICAALVGLNEPNECKRRSDRQPLTSTVKG